MAVLEYTRSNRDTYGMVGPSPSGDIYSGYDLSASLPFACALGAVHIETSYEDMDEACEETAAGQAPGDLHEQNKLYHWQLVEKTRQDDEKGTEAFEELWGVNYEMVRKYTLSRTSNADLAEEIAQTTFLKFYEKRASLTQKNGASVATYLTTIARNLISDHYKRRSTRTTTPTADIHGAEAFLVAQPLSPEEVVLASFRDRRLHEALAQLPEEQRRCITLHDFGDYSLAQVAAVLGKKCGAVKQQRRRTLAALRRILAEDEE